MVSNYQVQFRPVGFRSLDQKENKSWYEERGNDRSLSCTVGTGWTQWYPNNLFIHSKQLLCLGQQQSWNSNSQLTESGSTCDLIWKKEWKWRTHIVWRNEGLAGEPQVELWTVVGIEGLQPGNSAFTEPSPGPLGFWDLSDAYWKNLK